MMEHERAYCSIGLAVAIVALIFYGLVRSCITGRIILFSRYPRVFDRSESPVWYWFSFVFYMFLIFLIVSLTNRYARNIW
jgi:hypothetical protein